MECNAVDCFLKVRDVPFRLPEKIDDIDQRCFGKHRLLYDLLSKNGYRVRFRVCEFKWSDQHIPDKITKNAPFPIENHLYLEIFLDSKWIVLDCTNDSRLPSYNIWDGKNDCKIAVKYIRIFSVDESARIEKNEKDHYIYNFNKYLSYYRQLNLFFDSLRAIKKK